MLGMKLSEMNELDVLGVRVGIEEQLRASGQTELASVLVPEGSAGTGVYIATDVGFYVGTDTSSGRGKLEGELTPWGEVYGARMALAGFRNEYSTVLYRSTVPEVSVSASGAGSDRFRALVDLANLAMRYARGWMVTPSAEAAPPS